MTTAETHTANTILADLETKLAAAKQRQADAQAQIADVAYDAHCDDVGARKELQRAAAEAVKASGEIIGLEAAVAEAKRRANHASAVAADDVEREHARIALGLLGDFEKRGEALDHAMSKVLANCSSAISTICKSSATPLAPCCWSD